MKKSEMHALVESWGFDLRDVQQVVFDPAHIVVTVLKRNESGRFYQDPADRTHPARETCRVSYEPEDA